MTGNKSYLSDYEEINGGFVTFGGNSKGGKITRKGKFDGKADEGFFIGYSINSKAFRVFNSRNRIVEEALHITFLENKPNVAGSGLEWLFDIDTLIKSMNYKPVIAGNQTNGNAGTNESINTCQVGKKTIPSHEYILLPLWTPDSPISLSLKSSDDKVGDDVKKKTTKDPTKEDDKDDQDLREFERLIVQGKEAEININSTNSVSAVSSPVNTTRTKDDDVNSTNSIYTASPLVNFDGLSYFNVNPPDDSKMHNLEDTDIFGGAYDDECFKVWTLVDLPYGKRDIRTKWVYMNKKDERGFEDLSSQTESYKVEKAIYGLQQAPRACDRKRRWYFISQDTYVDENHEEDSSPPAVFDLESYSDSDFAGVSLDRKSTTKGCQFLGSRLISFQCKKQTIVANSTTEAEYVAAANCCVQTAQDLEITNLKKRVKKLEKKKKSRTPQLKRRLFKVRIESFAEKSLGDQEDASK
ncbi:ribonuclease H-like domain-containing protein [Tanacetum coccineum]